MPATSTSVDDLTGRPSTGAGGPTTVPARSAWRSTEWWYLGFLLMLVFQPLFDPDATSLDWVVVGGVITVFVPFYLHVQTRPGRLRRWSPVIATAFGVVAFPFSSGASVLAVYAASFAAAHRPRRTAMRWMAALSVGTLALAFVVPLPAPFALAAFAVPAVFVWVVGLGVLEETARERETERLRVDNVRIQHLATATERERIAGDLHDLTGHSLTSIVVRAQLVQRLAATDPAQAAQHAQEIERAARTALHEIRETVAGWRQVLLVDELDVARDALAAAGVALDVDREPDLDLAPSVEKVLGLALREAVTNVVRHADARRCTVWLGHRDGELVLAVTDDGVGGHVPDGTGLSGMRERVAALGGRVERSGDDGTRLVVAVPAQVAG